MRTWIGRTVMRFKVKWYGEDIKEITKSAVGLGVFQGLNHIKNEANILTPIETGALRNSATVKMVSETQGFIFYDTPYAIRQHEELTYRHDHPTRAKYLEIPFITEMDKVMKFIGNKIGSEYKRVGK